jgi:cytochrome b subunit of formate dehydrogenase
MILMLNKFKGVILGVVTAVAVLLMTYFTGKHTSAVTEELQDLKAHNKAKERVDAVKPSTDRDAAIQRLREAGRIR